MSLQLCSPIPMCKMARAHWRLGTPRQHNAVGSGGGCRVRAGTDPVRSRRSSSWPRWRRHGRGCRQTWAPPSGASPTCSWPWRSCAPATRATPRGEAAGSGGVLALGRAQQDCTPAGEAAFWLKSVFMNKSLRTDKGSHEKVSPLKSSRVAQLKRSRKDGEGPDHTAAPCSLWVWRAREAQRCPLPLPAVQKPPLVCAFPFLGSAGPVGVPRLRCPCSRCSVAAFIDQKTWLCSATEAGGPGGINAAGHIRWKNLLGKNGKSILLNFSAVVSTALQFSPLLHC